MIHLHLTQALALIVILGLMAQWVAWRLRLPAIVMLALTGIVAGPLLGVLDPHTQLGPLLEPVIKLGVAIILFEGGLSLELHELRAAATAVRRLTTWGVVLACVTQDCHSLKLCRSSCSDWDAAAAWRPHLRLRLSSQIPTSTQARHRQHGTA